LEKREDKLVWMQREENRTEQYASRRLKKRSKGRENSTVQRGKSAAEKCMVRGTGKHSKRGG